MPLIDDDELLRYSRQIMLPEVDVAGQERLRRAAALVVGLGGLGSPIALYLAAAGVGKLILADDDRVELSNLQRQIAHSSASVGKAKASSAKAAAAALNPRIEVEAVVGRMDANSLGAVLGGVDLALDASDNQATRFALNDACWRLGKPLVSGAAIRWEGQVAAFDPRDAASPCYRCLHADGAGEALNCAENGVIAPLVGVIGALQSMEAVKLICGVGESLVGRVLRYDGKRAEWRTFQLPKRPGCRTCDGRTAERLQ